MSRTRTTYPWLCNKTDSIGEDGRCEYHSGRWCKQTPCVRPRKWESRRGTEERKVRFPEGSIKSFHNGPPKWLKSFWWRKYRRRCDRDLKYGEYDTLQIFSQRRVTSLWDWY